MGKWLMIHDVLNNITLPKCSECGKVLNNINSFSLDISITGVMSYEYKYCPYCGKNMEEWLGDAD